MMLTNVRSYAPAPSCAVNANGEGWGDDTHPVALLEQDEHERWAGVSIEGEQRRVVEVTDPHQTEGVFLWGERVAALPAHSTRSILSSSSVFTQITLLHVGFQPTPPLRCSPPPF